MIRKFLQRVFAKTPAQKPLGAPAILKRAEHGVGRERISACAVKITSGLQAQGHSAFVVGGAVRDLLLGRDPKDFDVATSANPEQVRAVFRRSRIIGRRFRLVHVMCGADTVEVATFRGAAEVAAGSALNADEHGRILRDNVFGSQQEDAARRDFTINAMFYNPATEEILDYHDGYADLQAMTLRVIGEPSQRYREDPVRMLRAVRLSAKLGMTIADATRSPIAELAPLLRHVPTARVFDEMLKLLLSGHAAECITRLRDEGLHHGLLPMLDVILEQPMGERFVMAALKATDARVLAEAPVSPGFLFAALLWHEVLAAWNAAQQAGTKSAPALFVAMDQVIDSQAEKLAIPRRFGVTMKELWTLQARLLNRSGRRPYRMIEHPRFRAALDFLVLRCASGEVEPELGEWWQRFAEANEGERASMLLSDTEPKRRRRRRSKKPANVEAAPSEPPEQ
ncbi:MAG: polynucleotide adenylyltransferase PcnB [Burkholderiales bacterium]